jgi:NAD(P)H-dependent flavin oxidoreductase YrpB (nitropropane dioxygenase family)
MLSFGDASPFIARIKSAGIPVICQIQSLAQARQVLQEGADIIVAQGSEAGGHGAVRATLPLVPAVVDAVAASRRDVAVVAAGGIADGRGLAAALMLGAAGVLMGTRFHAAEESLLPRAAKNRIVSGSGDDTLRTKIFDIALGGRPQEYYRPRTSEQLQRKVAWPGGGARHGLCRTCPLRQSSSSRRFRHRRRSRRRGDRFDPRYRAGVRDCRARRWRG